MKKLIWIVLMVVACEGSSNDELPTESRSAEELAAEWDVSLYEATLGDGNTYGGTPGCVAAAVSRAQSSGCAGCARGTQTCPGGETFEVCIEPHEGVSPYDRCAGGEEASPDAPDCPPAGLVVAIDAAEYVWDEYWSEAYDAGLLVGYGTDPIEFSLDDPALIRCKAIDVAVYEALSMEGM